MTALAPIETPKAMGGGTGFAYEDVQQSIEHLYDLRSKVIRIGLLGTLLHRPDPQRPTTNEERADLFGLLKSEVANFNQVAKVVEDGRARLGIHPAMADWMHRLAQQQPDALEVVLRVNDLSLAVLKAAQDQSAAQSDALRAHRTAARKTFHGAITELCLFMWRSYDKDQSQRLMKTQEAAQVLGERLTRLERIGTHVRLVSLNASVEASHIGDRGRGLSVIAQEFKLLAEEVTNLAQLARQDVEMMQAIK